MNTTDPHALRVANAVAKPIGLVKRFRKSSIALVAILCTILFAADDCDGTSEGDGQQAETKTTQTNYDQLTKKQPAHRMNYSPSRDTKNFWIDTWGQPGKVSYVYLLSNGKPYAFAVLKRLPVTYCTSLVPPVKVLTVDTAGDGGAALLTPNPSIDGTFSSSSNCGAYYGEDATTGAYVEWTAGADTTMLLRDQPLPLNLYADALPLGDTTAPEAPTADDSKTILPPNPAG